MEGLKPLDQIANRFKRLPGIGPKTARRLAYFVLRMPEEEVQGFAQDLVSAREAIRICRVCGCMTDREVCEICSDPAREEKILCVVADTRDVSAIEKTMEFKGQYHVLNGAISPIDGVGPDDLRIPQLMERLKQGGVTEVILATNADVKGEATASYLARMIKPLGIKVTRIAHGIPIGGDLEYTDEVTLSQALIGRREY